MIPASGAGDDAAAVPRVSEGPEDGLPRPVPAALPDVLGTAVRREGTRGHVARQLARAGGAARGGESQSHRGEQL